MSTLLIDRVDLGPRFPERLAGLARDQVGEFVLALRTTLAKRRSGLDAEGERVRRPCRPGGARGGDLGVGVADLARPEFVAGGGFGRDVRVAPFGCGLHAFARLLVNLAGAS